MYMAGDMVHEGRVQTRSDTSAPKGVDGNADKENSRKWNVLVVTERQPDNPDENEGKGVA